jgi:hypothetical protein
MNYPKSKRRALSLSAITVFSFAITGAALNLLLPYWRGENLQTLITNPERLAQPGSLLPLFFTMLLILGLMTGLGAFWLFRFFGDAYFGSRAPLRWALFGILFAFFLKLPDWFFPANPGVFRAIIQLAGLFAAFFVARWLVPINKPEIKE